MSGSSLFTSNRVEWLYTQLRDQLFAPDQGPFATRLVAVPTVAMQQWLERQLAEDPQIGIAASTRFLFIDELVRALMEGSQGSAVLPSREQLTLKLEGVLRQWVVTGRKEPVLAPLYSYLKCEEKAVSPRTEQRITRLARKLAPRFSEYALYGSELIEQWEQEETATDWQGVLWKEVFASWTHWARELKKANKRQNSPFHVFGYSHLPPLFTRYLLREGCHIYLMSPSQAFWNDLCSDREIAQLMRGWERRGASEAQLLQLEHLLRDRNRLLANFGRLGREWSGLLDEGSPCEAFFAPLQLREHPAYIEVCHEETNWETHQERLTALDCLQADLLWLRSPEQPVELKEDRSIQVHGVPNRWREMEVLTQVIGEVMTHHADRDPITPGDILVMAPDIGTYVPLIDALFDQFLPYEIQDVSTPKADSIEQGFQWLVTLASSRWEASRLLALFDHPCFCKQRGWGDAELAQLRQWVDRVGIRWGQDAAHRHSCLSQAYGRAELADPEGATTWKEGLSRLIAGLATGEGGIELSDAELLNGLLSIVDQLIQDLLPIQQNDRRTIGEWVACWEGLVHRYFGFNEEEDLLRYAFESLRQLSIALPDEVYPCASLYQLFQDFLAKKANKKRTHELDTIRFCSLVPMRAIPAKVIVLLGMEEGNFPNPTIRDPLDRLRDNRLSDRVPTRVDFDRYLFLETILSARQALICCYCEVASSDGQPQAPSLLVQELVGYLDEMGTFDGKPFSQVGVTHHPFTSCHASYFSEPGRVGSLERYHEAQALYHLKRPSHCLVSAVETFAPEPLPNRVIDLRELRATSADPIRAYLQRTLGLVLEEASLVADDEPFAWDGLATHRLVWEAVHHVWEDVIVQADQQGALPPAPFRSLFLRSLERRVTEIHEGLKRHGLTAADLYAIHLVPGCDGPQRHNDQIIVVPSLKIPLQSGEVIELVGEIPWVSHQGLFARGKGDLPAQVKAWSDLLVLSHLVSTLPERVPAVLVPAKGRRSVDLEPRISEGALQGYLAYHLAAREQLAPFLPACIEPALRQQPHEWLQLWERALGDEHASRYARWAFRWRASIDAQEVIEAWHPLLERAFGPLIQGESDAAV